MPLELTISPQDIDDLIKGALLKAGLGKHIEKGIHAALGDSYRNPINEAIKNFIQEIAAQLVREKFREEIVAAVTKIVSERVTTSMIDATIDTVMKKIEASMSDRY